MNSNGSMGASLLALGKTRVLIIPDAVKYRSIIELFLDFFANMRGNKQKDTKLPYAKLTRSLKATGFLSERV